MLLHACTHHYLREDTAWNCVVYLITKYPLIMESPLCIVIESLAKHDCNHVQNQQSDLVMDKGRSLPWVFKLGRQHFGGSLSFAQPVLAAEVPPAYMPAAAAL